jgi:hypothetical protein
MPAPLTALALLQSWLELAERETDAIQRADWTALRHCQDQIRLLQQEWNSAAARANPLKPPAGADHPRSSEVGTLLNALLERERYNQRLLAERRERLEGELAYWNAVAVRLRRFWRGPGSRARSGWSGLS